jgi:hypothetical protein
MIVHSKNAQQAQRTIEHMSKVYEVTNYHVSVTEKQLKKVPPCPQCGAGYHPAPNVARGTTLPLMWCGVPPSYIT